MLCKYIMSKVDGLLNDVLNWKASQQGTRIWKRMLNYKLCENEELWHLLQPGISCRYCRTSAKKGEIRSARVHTEAWVIHSNAVEDAACYAEASRLVCEGSY